MRSEIHPLDLVVSDRGALFVPELVAIERDDGTWEGRIRFRRIGGAEVLETPVETTQPNARALEYWAGGLTMTYFDGAIARARGDRPDARPVYDESAPAASRVERAYRVTRIERYVLSQFHRAGTVRLPTSSLFDHGPWANADLVRAFEDLEKKLRLVVRRTEEGTDWLYLTVVGARSLGLAAEAEEPAVPDPKPSIP